MKQRRFIDGYRFTFYLFYLPIKSESALISLTLASANFDILSSEGKFTDSGFDQLCAGNSFAIFEFNFQLNNNLVSIFFDYQNSKFKNHVKISVKIMPCCFVLKIWNSKWMIFTHDKNMRKSLFGNFTLIVINAAHFASKQSLVAHNFRFTVAKVVFSF